MLFKLFIAIIFTLIIISLGAGLFFMMNEKPQSKHMVNSLTIRIVLSVVLFIALFVGFKFGWIQPHGLGG